MTRWLITALLLAGCATTTSNPPMATVAVTPRAGAEAPPARGETALIVRATMGDSEISGAACTVDAPYFSASFTAPARVLLPDYGSQSPEVRVTCRAEEARGTVAARPSAAASGGIGGWPAVGISVGGGQTSGAGVGISWYGGAIGASTGMGAPARYPELRVPLSPGSRSSG